MSRPSQWLGTLEGLAYILLRPLLLCNTKSHSSMTNSTLDTLSMTDEELVKLAISSPKVDSGAYHISTFQLEESGPVINKVPNVGIVARITPNAVAKHCFFRSHLELLATNIVRENTCIPVPLCDRLVRGTGCYHLVQEYIPGCTVWSAWAKLGWWTRFRIALTIRYYIYQLRSMKIPERIPLFPGPPALDGKPQLCEGRLFTREGSGPFRRYRDLSRWYQNRLLVMQRFRKAETGITQFDDSGPLVFTHQDLHPQNLILGDDGQLWVIDWANAGWYPPWFEGASMDLFTHNRKLDDLPGWTTFIPFIAGSYKRPGQLPFILAIYYSLEVLQANIMNLVRYFFLLADRRLDKGYLLQIDCAEQ